MANLKRNMIELVEEIKEGEIVTKKYLTPIFIPLSVLYEALDLIEEVDQTKKEQDMIEKMLEFVTTNIYKNQFTKDDLIRGLHSPDASKILYQQILFITQGAQSDDTKKFMSERKN
jgi:hypothetical protein